MPYANGLITRESARSTSTVYHHSKPEKKKRSNINLLEHLTPLTPDATIEAYLAHELKSGLVYYVVMNSGSSDDFNQFCHAFADSSVPLLKKFDYINEVTSLKSYSPYRLCQIISDLLKECSTTEDFITFINPQFRRHFSYFTECSMKSFIKNFTGPFLKNLEPEEFFAMLTVTSFKDEPFYKSFFRISYSWECHTPLLKAVQRIIPKCKSDMILNSTLQIINEFLDNCVLKKRLYVCTYEQILLSLNALLNKIEKPEDIFEVLKKCPEPKYRPTVLAYVNLCIRAYARGMPKDEVMILLDSLFQTYQIPFDELSLEEQGHCLYYLIDKELLPDNFSLSKYKKESLFQFIINKLPIEKRKETVLSISNHDDTPLNKHLWPQTNFLFFAPTLPGKWVKEINSILTEKQGLDSAVKA